MTSTVYRVMLLSIKNNIMVGPEKPAILDSYFEFVSSLQQGIYKHNYNSHWYM